MDLKLRREVPTFRRCCFCIPLRRGLLGWGYAKLLLNILIITYMILILTILIHFAPLIYLSTYMVVVVVTIIDVGFTGLLIFACHRKSCKLLRISYIYGIVWLTLYVAFGAYGLISDAIRMVVIWEYYASHKFLIVDLVATSSLLFGSIFFQVYVILLTRSESVKLRNQNLEMEFVNNAADAEARCVPSDKRDTEFGDAKYTPPYSENGHDTSQQRVY